MKPKRLTSMDYRDTKFGTGFGPFAHTKFGIGSHWCMSPTLPDYYASDRKEIMSTNTIKKPKKRGPKDGRIWTHATMARIGRDLFAYIRRHESCLSILEFCEQYSPRLDSHILADKYKREGYEVFTGFYSLAKGMLQCRWIEGAAIRDQPCGPNGLGRTTKLDPRFAIFVLASRFGMRAKSTPKIAVPSGRGIIIELPPDNPRPE